VFDFATPWRASSASELHERVSSRDRFSWADIDLQCTGRNGIVEHAHVRHEAGVEIRAEKCILLRSPMSAPGCIVALFIVRITGDGPAEIA